MFKILLHVPTNISPADKYDLDGKGRTIIKYSKWHEYQITTVQTTKCTNPEY
jgi:hypothetical protein